MLKFLTSALKGAVVIALLKGSFAFSQKESASTPPSLQERQTIEEKSEKTGLTTEIKETADSSMEATSKTAVDEPTRHIELAPNGSQIIRLAKAAEQVVVTNPKIINVRSDSSTSLYISALSSGDTELVITEQGPEKKVYSYTVHVQYGPNELDAALRKVAPNDSVKVTMLPQGALLQGSVSSAQAAADIQNVTQLFVGKKGSIISQLTTKGPKQINLHIKIAEVRKSVTNSLAVNWSGLSSVKSHFRLGVSEGRSITPIDPISGFGGTGGAPRSVGAAFNDQKNNLAAVIDALASENLASVLAEPNLITRSGEEASFLVGGEFPYPVSQGGTGANASVTIQFKQYGISLSFLPIVTNENISLRVKTEVSSLDINNSSKDATGNTVPALQTRRAESTVEMGNGQSMILAGMLSDQTVSSIDGFPALANVPILGALFRSENFLNQKTELVIVATPYLVEPFDNPQDISLPTQNLKFAKLIDMVLHGDIIETMPADSFETSAHISSLNGPAGFHF